MNNFIKQKLLILLILTGFTGKISGQSGKDFTPGGKPVFLLFTNVHSGLNTEGYSPAFEITRLYLGYEYSFTRSLSARANIDIGDPGVGNLKMTAYVKNAFLQYKTESFSGRIGMIGTDGFNLIERQWNYRYISKTLQDEFGLGPSADLGAAFEYSPAHFISLDASVLNGEGYKNIQSDSTFKYTLGVTLKPFEGFLLRGYTDFMKKDKLQNTISIFAGYTHESLRLGLEYSYQKNNRMVSGHDFSGISAFASLNIAKSSALVGRYDNMQSTKVDNSFVPWNYGRDGQLFMAGYEYSPVKGIRIAPVFTGWLPANSDKPFTFTPGIYFEIRL